MILLEVKNRIVEDTLLHRFTRSVQCAVQYSCMDVPSGSMDVALACV